MWTCGIGGGGQFWRPVVRTDQPAVYSIRCIFYARVANSVVWVLLCCSVDDGVSIDRIAMHSLTLL